MENNTNILNNCTSQQTIKDFSYFLKCYSYLCRQNLIQVILVYILFITSIVFNSIILIIIILNRRNTLLKTKKIFDSILLSQTISNLFNSLFNIPMFHVFFLFKHWSFGSGNTFQTIWIISYESIISIIIFHIFYLSYVRLRSVQNPNGFNFEKIIKKTKFVLASIWIINFVIWIPITIGFGPIKDSIEIHFKPVFLKSLINLMRLFPLIISNILSGLLVWIVYKMEKNVHLNKFQVKKTCRLFTIDDRKVDNSKKKPELHKINSILHTLFLKLNLGTKQKIFFIIIMNTIQW